MFMVVTDDGTVMLEIPVQLRNAVAPIDVTEDGMTRWLSTIPLQYWKASAPILVILLGMVRDVNPEHPEKVPALTRVRF